MTSPSLKVTTTTATTTALPTGCQSSAETITINDFNCQERQVQINKTSSSGTDAEVPTTTMILTNFNCPTVSTDITSNL
jgi:hypothetical protein